MRWMLLVALLCPVAVLAADGGSGSSAAACPDLVRGAPEYPDDMRRAHLEASVILDLRVDGCGRVLDAGIAETSGHASFDAAALAASRGWVLGKDVAAGGGNLRVPLDFKLSRLASYPHVGNDDWPASHRRVRYLPDNLYGYTTPEQVLERYDLRPQAALTPPYPYVRNMLLRQQGDDPVEYWLFMYMEGKARVAARYRLVTENGEPMVRVAFLCEGPRRQCAQDRRLVMKGLPFAKAK
ncbi:MAG: TonB family protein [Pseudoxanthomonas sp.]